MSEKIFIFISVFIFSLIFPYCCEAQITVSGVILSFKSSDRPVANVYVNNSAKDIVHVSADVMKIINSGKPNEERVPTQDLIVSPKHFSVKGGDRRSVRLLMREPHGELESVYRITFLPHVAPLDEPPKAGLNLRVVTGVGMLVFNEPAKPNPVLKWTKKGSELTFKNDGNMNIFLNDLRACDPANYSKEDLKEEDLNCTNLDIRVPRLYPGDEFTVKVPTGKMIILTKNSNENLEKIEILSDN